MATSKIDKTEETAAVEKIKKIAIMAMFSDDELMDELVLKGGNAMALIHRLSARASVDLDFSMKHDFPHGPKMTFKRIEMALTKTFRAAGYEPFDIKMEEKPKAITDKDMASFWGGYAVEFKLVDAAFFNNNKDDPGKLSRSAISIGQGKKFLIDISRFEYTDDKQEANVDGYRIYVYSPTMIACEKLRAICQQMEEYGPIVKRARAGSPRARDFFDIFILVETLKLDLRSQKSLDMLAEMFRLKRVPIEWLGLIEKDREFHRQGFAAVTDTVSPDVDLKSFDFYFDYVVELAASITKQLGSNS